MNQPDGLGEHSFKMLSLIAMLFIGGISLLIEGVVTFLSRKAPQRDYAGIKNLKK